MRKSRNLSSADPGEGKEVSAAISRSVSELRDPFHRRGGWHRMRSKRGEGGGGGGAVVGRVSTGEGRR